MKNLVKFEFKSREIRTVTDEHGEVWFVAKDVCDILGIGTEQIRRIPDTQKGLRQMQTPGGPQNLSIISEAGLYRLVLRSDKSEAEPFIDWVTSEVLPSIRKTGAYVPEDYVKALRAYADALEEKQLAEKKVDALQIALSESKEWYSVIRMNKLNGRRERDEYFDWKPLKKASASLGYEIKRVFDQNYGKINAYHRDVWEEVYGTEINFGD